MGLLGPFLDDCVTRKKAPKPTRNNQGSKDAPIDQQDKIGTHKQADKRHNADTPQDKSEKSAKT